jgi:hypothetical protein
VSNYAGTATAPSGWPTPGKAAGAPNSIWAYTTTLNAPINLTNFTLNVPAGKTIAGIAVTVVGAGSGYEASAPEEGGKALCCPPPLSGGSATVALQLIGPLGSLIGSPMNTQLQSTANYYPVGGSTALWGTSGLTVGDVNSGNFGVQIKMTFGSELDIDSVNMTVYYTDPALIYGQWMAGSYGPDGSWRLAQSLTSLSGSILKVTTSNKVTIGSVPAGNDDPFQVGGSTRATAYNFFSSRDYKIRITPVPPSGVFSLLPDPRGKAVAEGREGAWDLLDKLSVVDYEYRKLGRRYQLLDGSVVESLDGLTSAVTRVVDGRSITQDLSGEALVADQVAVWLDEGSGEIHRGFVAEELPKELTADGKSVSLGDVAANNTAALKEAKRRIQELEKEVAALNEIAAATGLRSQSSVLGTQSSVLGSQSSVLSTQSSVLSLQTLPDAEVLRLTESVLRKMGVEPWVEITAAEAWEEADETTPVSAVETVTRYRFSPDTRLAEAYTVQETVTRQEPTGRRVIQLKKDVRLDEKTGKFYRWCGLGGTTPSQTSAALFNKLLPGVVVVLNRATELVMMTCMRQGRQQ